MDCDRPYDLSDIYNGADCKSYRWSQSHADLEIRVALLHPVDRSNICVQATSASIIVRLKGRNLSTSSLYHTVLLDRRFTNPVDTSSLYWTIDMDDYCVSIYIDKCERSWWKSLFQQEQVTTSGRVERQIRGDDLDDASRAVIDRLIVEQRHKLSNARVTSTP